MEFWTGSQGQPPLYTKYGTVPGQNLSHMYQEKQHAPDFQQPYEKDFVRDLSWWTVPGSRTGWVLQDHSNWTDPQPPDFPFTLDSQPRSQGFNKHQGYERAEREWARAEMERARKQQESERKMQREGWVRRGEPCSPFRSRRDAKRSISDSSYRELEAWASRYCHSLPRKRRLEAGLWGAQGFQRGQVQEREMISQWVGRGGSANFQGTYPPPAQHHPMRGWGQEEERQPTIPLRLPQSPVLERSWEQDSKENEPSYQHSMLSQPPSYILPPPYSAPHNSLHRTQQPQKYAIKDMSYTDPIIVQQHAQEYNYYTLMASAKQDVHGDVRREQQAEEVWTEKWERRKQPELHVRQGQFDERTWEGSTPPPKPLSDSITQPPFQGQPEITAELRQPTLPEASESVKAKQKKKRGRETVFCLVSRLGEVAGLSSSPEDPLQSISLPLFTVPNLTGAASAGAGVLKCEGSEGSGKSFQLADEVDSRVTERHHQFSSPSSAPPIQAPPPKMSGSSGPQAARVWMESEQAAAHREELFRAVQTGPRFQTERSNYQSLISSENRESAKAEGPQVSASPEISKRVQQPHGPAKFPLWKEPSIVAQTKTKPTWQCIKGNWEQQGEPAKNLSYDQDDSSINLHNYITDGCKEERILEDAESDGNSGIFVIDATCVVVRAEFIFPPKKEHVQYLSAAQSLNPGLHSDPGILNNHPDVSSEPNSDVLPQDQLLQGSEEKMGRESERDMLQSQEPDSDQNISLPHEGPETDEAEGTSEFSDPCLPSPVIPANETLEERAVRILGIPLLDSSIRETKSVESPIDPAGHNTGGTQESPTELPSMEREPEVADKSGQDEDVICLYKSDTAMDSQLFMNMENTPPSMDIEERGSKEEDLELVQLSVHDSSEEDGTDIFIEMQGVITHKDDFEEGPSTYPQVNQEAASQPEDSYILPPPSQSHCPVPTYLNSSPPKSPTLKLPLRFPLPPSNFPSNELLQVPSPLSNNASCCFSTKSVSRSCSPSRVHSPSCPICPSSLPSDSISLSHFPFPPFSPFAPRSPASSSFSFDVPTSSGHESPKTAVETSPPHQSSPPLQKDEPQYPKSLWDAVYRIRRHTAPDSENEEEEGGDLWDNTENVSEDKETKAASIDLRSKMEVEDRSLVQTEAQSQEVLEEDTINYSGSLRNQAGESRFLEAIIDSEMPDSNPKADKVGLQEEKQGDEKLSGQVDDDTLSCSSSDSHNSRDTVIMGREEEEAERRGAEIGEGVRGNEARVETDANQTTQESFNCKDEMCGSSGEILENITKKESDSDSDGDTWEVCKHYPTEECFGDGEKVVLAVETDIQNTAETNPERNEHSDLAFTINGEGCLCALVDSNVSEDKRDCVTVAMIKNAESYSDTNETEGNQYIRLVVENNEVTEDVRSERICMEMATCSRPEEEGANMKKETSECTGHTAECHYADDAMPNRDTVPEPGMGLTCDLFVTGVPQQGEETAALVTDQQEASILPPEEEGNHALEDILQEKERALFVGK